VGLERAFIGVASGSSSGWMRRGIVTLSVQRDDFAGSVVDEQAPNQPRRGDKMPATCGALIHPSSGLNDCGEHGITAASSLLFLG
jgi:hypothetical protein